MTVSTPGPVVGCREARSRSTRRVRLASVLTLALALSLTLGGCAIPRWPVEGPMSSAFGVRWRSLLPEVHRGVDFAVPVGTPIRAMAGGRVRFAGVQSGYGNVIWIDHGGAVLTVYAHLSQIQVNTGQSVSPQQVIGLSGQSGNVTGAHLHFEVWRWDQPVDPVPLLGNPGSS